MGLYLLIPTFIVVFVSFMIVRAGAIALRMTGLDEKTANFQALSAFTRAGFTTKESEAIVNHPQRRSIVTWLIILGNAGIVAVIVTGTSSLATTTDYWLIVDVAGLFLGAYIVYGIIRHTGFARRWERIVENRLLRRMILKKVPVEHLLHLAGGYGVVKVPVLEESPYVGVSTTNGRFHSENSTLLGVERLGQWIPIPESLINTGDVLVLFGKIAEMEKNFGKTG